MKNVLSHLIHLTIITEFEILFYIYYIVPFERDNIYKMFEYSQTNANYVNKLNSSALTNLYCDKEKERIQNYNNKLFEICYYYIGGINILVLGAFLYDLRKNFNLYYGFNLSIPKVLSSPKYLSTGFDIDLPSSEIQMVTPRSTELPPPTDEPNDNNQDRFILFYWKNSRFVAKMCETIQFIILLGGFEYIFFTYLFDKFKIISIKLILCNLLNQSQ